MRKWVLVLGVLLVAGGGCGYYAYRTKADAPAAAAAAARTVQAAQGKLEVKVSGSGTVAADDARVLKAGYKGTVEKVLVSAGDKVKKGQELVTFQKADNDMAIRQKKLELEKGELQLKGLKQQYWQESDAGKQDELMLQIDTAKLTQEQLQAEIDELEAEQAENNDLVADADGTITAVSVSSGQELNGNEDAVTLTDYSKLTFTMSADELDVPKLKTGQTASISLNALSDRTFTGKITEIAREGESSNGVATYPVSIQLSELDGVLAGMSGSVEIVTDTAENAVLVPIAAVVQLNGKSYVRVPDDGSASGATGAVEQTGAEGSGQNGGADRGSGGWNRPNAEEGFQAPTGTGAGASRMALGGRMVEVKTGLVNDQYAQIESGLNAGDSVLVPLPTGTQGGSTGSSGNVRMIQGGMGMGGMGGGFQRGAAPGGMGGGMGGRN